MLERRHRLTTAAGFSAATRGGRRAGTATLVLHLAVPDASTYTGADPGEPPRVGFGVGRRVGNAVTRNRVRRRLRHLLRDRLVHLPGGSLLVARALPAAAAASYDVLGRDLDRALDRLGRPLTSAPAARASR